LRSRGGRDLGKGVITRPGQDNLIVS
jgi:hypothetical protein